MPFAMRRRARVKQHDKEPPRGSRRHGARWPALPALPGEASPARGALSFIEGLRLQFRHAPSARTTAPDGRRVAGSRSHASAAGSADSRPGAVRCARAAPSGRPKESPAAACARSRVHGMAWQSPWGGATVAAAATACHGAQTRDLADGRRLSGGGGPVDTTYPHIIEAVGAKL